MKLVLLSEKFFHDFAHCPEILQKKNRPYACLTVRIDGVLFAIPFRHHISHRYAFITYADCGLDYTKAVVIRDSSDLSPERPVVDSAEWNAVRRGENKILYGFKSYLNQYRRAMRLPDNPRSANILKYSSLQYFQEYI